MSWACEYDGPKFYAEEERVSRKHRECIECNAPILLGERYLSCRGKWDGSIATYSQHLLCRDACVWIRDRLEGECIPFGGLHGWWANTRFRNHHQAQGWRIGAKMYALIRRRERLAREAKS